MATTTTTDIRQAVDASVSEMYRRGMAKPAGLRDLANRLKRADAVCKRAPYGTAAWRFWTYAGMVGGELSRLALCLDSVTEHTSAYSLGRLHGQVRLILQAAAEVRHKLAKAAADGDAIAAEALRVLDSE